MFKNILGRKKAFPDYKNNKLKKAKIWDFSKENTVGVILSGARAVSYTHLTLPTKRIV